MFCRICGYELPENAQFCSRCGTHVETSEFVPTAEESTPAEPAKYSGKAIAGFVIALVGIMISAIPCGIIGIVFSVLGKKETVELNKKGKGLAIAGLVISILDIVLGVINVINVMGTMSYYF